jgi:hypothetical protein
VILGVCKKLSENIYTINSFSKKSSDAFDTINRVINSSFHDPAILKKVILPNNQLEDYITPMNLF